LRGCNDRIRVDAVMPVELGNRTGLAEMLDAEWAEAMAVDRAQPAERRRMAVDDADDAAMPGVSRIRNLSNLVESSVSVPVLVLVSSACYDRYFK